MKLSSALRDRLIALGYAVSAFDDGTQTEWDKVVGPTRFTVKLRLTPTYDVVVSGYMPDPDSRYPVSSHDTPLSGYAASVRMLASTEDVLLDAFDRITEHEMRVAVALASLRASGIGMTTESGGPGDCVPMIRYNRYENTPDNDGFSFFIRGAERLRVEAKRFTVFDNTNAGRAVVDSPGDLYRAMAEFFAGTKLAALRDAVTRMRAMQERWAKTPASIASEDAWEKVERDVDALLKDEP